MFVTEAQAQAQGGAGDAFVSLVPFLLVLVIMYFLLIRPQQKKAKQHREMVAALRRGDTVVTAGGIVAKVVGAKGDGDRIRVEIAKGGVYGPVRREGVGPPVCLLLSACISGAGFRRLRRQGQLALRYRAWQLCRYPAWGLPFGRGFGEGASMGESP